MTSYTCFEDLEASVPFAQLRSSLAFSRCAAQLPHDIDQLHGAELVQSLEIALTVHSKARVVLQWWVLLIMRRQVDARHEKDALYDWLQNTIVSPQEKIRYRRGAMLLCHLLIERDVAEADSLLDRYLVDSYFPWSSAVNVRDDTFYLQADVNRWVRQALDYFKQNKTKMTAARWLELSRSSSSPVPSVFVPLVTDQRDAPYTNASSEVMLTPAAQRTRTRTPPFPASTQHWAAVPASLKRNNQTHTRKRRRTAVASDHRELEALKTAIVLWAKRLRRQLLQAAGVDDKDRIRQVADELQAPPLLNQAEDRAGEQSENEDESGHDDDIGSDSEEDSDDRQRRRHRLRADRCSAFTDSDDSSNSSLPQHVNECAVCESDPKKVEQVWNLSCRHGFCGDCMLARLSQRERRCMYCRAKIVQVIDGKGLVFQHYDWTKWWAKRRQRQSTQLNYTRTDSAIHTTANLST
jgi:hypothetical protein